MKGFLEAEMDCSWPLIRRLRIDRLVVLMVQNRRRRKDNRSNNMLPQLK